MSTANDTKSKFIEKRSSIIDENKLQQQSEIPADDFKILRQIILTAYSVYIELENSEIMIYQVLAKSTCSDNWYSTPHHFSINEINACDLIKVDLEKRNFLSKDLLLPVFQDSSFKWCIMLCNSYIISAPILETKIKNFVNITLKNDKSLAQNLTPLSNFSIVNSGNGILLLADTVQILFALIQLLKKIKSQDHLGMAMIVDRLECEKTNDEWFNENFENQMRSLDTFGIHTGYEYEFYNPYESPSDIPAENYQEFVKNSSLMDQDDELSAGEKRNKSSVSAPLFDISNQYHKVSLLGKRFSLKHGIDTSHEWISSKDLEKCGPNVMKEVEEKYKSMSLDDKSFENQNLKLESFLKSPTLARSNTFTGDECLDQSNISKDLKQKHALMKQASILDSDNKINPGPQSIILADDTIENLHRISTENSKNLSNVLSDSFNEVERRASKGVVDWDARRKSFENSSPPQNPFKQLDKKKIKSYKKTATMNTDDKPQTLNLDLNEASVTGCSSSSLSSDKEKEETKKDEKKDVDPFDDNSNWLNKNTVKRKSFRKTLGSLLKKENPSEFKITNLDSIEVTQEPFKSKSKSKDAKTKKRKSFKRLFSFNRN